MADFFQNGVISTLPKLGDRPLVQIEEEIRRFTSRQKVALILPALYSEFEGEAMFRIVRELEAAGVHEIALNTHHLAEAVARGRRRGSWYRRGRCRRRAAGRRRGGRGRRGPAGGLRGLACLGPPHRVGKA